MLPKRNRVSFIFTLILMISAAFLIAGDRAKAGSEQSGVAESPGKVTARADRSDRLWLNLQDGYESHVNYRGDGSSALAADVAGAKPSTLASADINRDGFPDLVSGYATGDGGRLVVRFGDPEAFGPTKPEILEGIRNGRYPASFLSNAAVIKIPEAPDFLAAGDFDRDGQTDLLTAARGSSTIFLFSTTRKTSKNGQNLFDAPRPILLSGQITALTAGRDNTSPFEDLAVGIINGAGSQVLFYATKRSIPEETPAVYSLNSPATSMAIGQLDDSAPTDLAVTNGIEVLIIHGSGDASPSGDSQSFYQSQIESLQIAAPSALAIGDFVPDRESRMELAVLSGDGTIYVKSRGQLDTRPFTAAEILERRKQAEAMRRSGKFDVADTSKSGASDAWIEAQTMYAPAAAQNSGSSKSLLFGGNFSSSAGDELMVLDAANRKVEVLMNDTDLQTGNLVSMQRTDAAIDLEDVPIAVLPMRLGVIGQSGLVLLGAEKIDPVIMQVAPTATFDVDRTDDNAGATACTAAANDCSLRGAISASNANGVTTDTITFSANAPVLTIAGNDNANANGDLDINGSLTVTGNGAATTILGTNFTAASASDGKVFGVNQNGGINGLTVSFSGVTIQNGFNKTPCGTFQETGGGGDFFLTGTGNAHSMTNVIVKNNTTTGCAGSRGGGINVDSTNTGTVGGASAGAVTFTSCTFTGNKSDAEGGGLNLAADKHDVTVNSSTFGGATAAEGNQATVATSGNGGGIDIEHSFGGTVTINSGTTVQNNTAARSGGGIVITFNPNVSITGASILNNTSNSSGGASAAGGGVVINPTGVAGFTPTITLSGSNISNNVATAGATGQGGGVYFNSPYSATLSNLTISGNSADRGAGVFNGGSSATPAATLTINGTGGATTISNNAATASGGGVANVDSTGAATIINGTTNAITIDNNTAGSGADGIDQTLDAGGTGSTMTLQGTINVNSGDSIFISRGNFNSTSGTLNLTGNLTNAGGTVSLPGTSNITGSITNSSGTMTIGGTTNLAGDFSFSGGTFSQTGGTVNFNGTGTQQITGGATPTFFNLTDSNTAAQLTVNNNINANGNLAVNANAILNPAAATIVGGAGTLTGGGWAKVTRTAATADFLSQYTITNKTLTNLLVLYGGSAPQVVSAITYGGLGVDNASGATLASGTTTVGQSLQLTQGVLAVGTNTLVLNGSTAILGASLTSSATGTVNYNQSSNGQNVIAANYGNLTFSNFNKTLPAGTVSIAGTFTPGSGTPTVTGNTINFNGTAAQTIPVFPYNNLTLNNAAGATLVGNTSVPGVLTLTAGALATGANVLTVTTTGSLARTTGFVNGALRKDFPAPGAFIFAVGTASGYAPVDANVTIGSGNLTVTGIQGPMPFINGAQALQRYWNLNGTGITAQLVFNYNQTDVLGTESSYRIHWQELPSNYTVNWLNQCPALPCVDTVLNKASTGNVSRFSNWTIAVPLAPTAASASVAGRVVDQAGRGLANAIVSSIDPNGVVHSARTGSFGYYEINDLPAGQTYNFSVRAKGFIFSTQALTLTGNMSGLDFVGVPLE